MLSGSVSHYCLSDAVCPVVAVPLPSDGRAEDAEGLPASVGRCGDAELRSPGRQAPRLVVGVDASAESLAAARYAVMAAEMRRCDVSLVHAFLTRSARAT